MSYPTTLPTVQVIAPLVTYKLDMKLLGSTLQNEFVNIYKYLNFLTYSGFGKDCADIAYLRTVPDEATYTAATFPDDVPAQVGQIRKVLSVNVGGGTIEQKLYMATATAQTDADGTSNVDTDGIVTSTVASNTLDWIEVGGTNYIVDKGDISRRTIKERLKINLDTDSVASDCVLEFVKRSAGSQVKILTNEEVAIRNAADSAYEDLAALSGTWAGTASAYTATALVASTTIPMLRFGIAIVGGSANGTMVGANYATMAGDWFNFQVAGVSKASLSAAGALVLASSLAATTISGTTGTFSGAVSIGGSLDMNSNTIDEVANAVSGTSAPNLAQVQSLIADNTGPLHGDESDGATTVAGTTTLTQDLYASTLSVTGTLNTAGYRVFFDTLSGNGVIQNNGVAGTVGANATNGAPGAGGGGAAGTNAGSLGGSTAGTAGGNGSAAGNGDAGTAGTASAITLTGGAGAAGGAGGPGNIPSTGGAGGAAGASSATSKTRLRDLVTATNFYDLVTGGLIKPRGGSAGGGGGGASGGGQCGAGGGGGGSSGGPVFLCGRVITFTGTIKSNGGAGGAGGNSYADGTGSGGGGGGGSGGIIVICASTNGLGYTTEVTAGAGGAAGTPITGGYTGIAGSAGATGTVITITP